MNSAQIQFQLGMTALSRNQVREALAAFERTAQLAPRAAPAHHMVGIALQRLGRLPEADRAITRAIELDRNEPDFLSNRSLVRCGMQQNSAAIADAEAALRLAPTHVGALCNLGLALIAEKRYVDAAKTFTRLVRVAPDFAQAHDNLALAVGNIEDIDVALTAAKAFAEAAPRSAKATKSLGSALHAVGDPESAAQAFERSVAQAPDDLGAHSLRLFNLNYLDDVTAAERIIAAHAFTEALARSVRPRQHQPQPDQANKTLRLGFVSGDLREHSVSHFLRTVLPEMKGRSLHLVAYQTDIKADAMTERLKAVFDDWRDITELSDEATADLIAADAIDILFDLVGHTAGQRQRLFALRPAPVAVTWLGYSATTGNPGIDYVLCNDTVMPPGEEACFTERPLRMNGSFLCFSPPENAPELVAAGRMTFGSFNTLNKISNRTVALWSRILTAVPQSDLLLKAAPLKSPETRAATAARFAAHGIAPERIVMLPKDKDRASHLAKYGRVHLALDPWPYAGTTTTMEALTMGIPVLTLNDGPFISRMSASLLTSAGLEEWIAGDEETYVAKAVAAAANPDALVAMRPEIRAQVTQSELFDAKGFAEKFDVAMRQIWQRWCAGVASAPH